MSQERISVEQVAKRAGVSTQNIQRFVEAKLLVPEDGHSFGVTAVTLARLLASIEAAGIPASALGDAVEQGLLSFAFLDVVLARDGSSVVDETFDDRCRSIGTDPEVMAQAIEAAGLPRPRANDLIRREDRDGIADLAAALEATKDPLVVFRFLRVLGDSLRRIAEVEAHAYHHAFEEPLLRSGMDEREMRQVVSQRSPELEAMAERILLWLSRRHRDHQTVDHLISHVEDAMDPALFDFERQKSPPAIGFLDLTGYTNLTEEIGDEAAARVAEVFRTLTDRVAAEIGGRAIKWLGDGVMLFFSRVAEGVSFGLEMIERAPRSELPPAHFGLSAGPVIYQGGDYFGRTVNTAARVAAYAAAGEVLVTDDVVRNCAGDGWEFTSLGTVRLKGVPDPVLLHRATPIGVRTPE
jgi:adenylate cyclase